MHNGVFAIFLILGTVVRAAVSDAKPHILYILADDFGWADADWHHPSDWCVGTIP